MITFFKIKNKEKQRNVEEEVTSWVINYFPNYLKIITESGYQTLVTFIIKTSFMLPISIILTDLCIYIFSLFTHFFYILLYFFKKYKKKIHKFYICYFLNHKSKKQNKTKPSVEIIGECVFLKIKLEYLLCSNSAR